MGGSTPLSSTVIIAGAGPVGLLCAALLEQRAVDCMVIDAAQARQPGDRDARALALSVATHQVLKNLRVWDSLPGDEIGLFQRMHVWQASTDGSVSFDSADLCEPVLGYIVNQALLEQVLNDSLQFARTTRMQRGVAVTALRWCADAIEVKLSDARCLRAKLLVAADGARSRVRELAGIACPVRDYRQTAVACLVATGKCHENVARQIFLPTGPLAFLPLADDNECGVVWTTTAEHAAQLLAMSDEAFNNALATAFSARLGEITSSRLRQGFPLRRAHAESYCKPRLALIGDAAHNIHPLAGQGFNLGVLDAACLVESLLRSGKRDADPGARPELRAYERWRKGETLLMISALESLKWLCESSSRPVQWLRDMGMRTVDSSNLLKAAIMRRAMGLAGDLPAIARRDWVPGNNGW